MQIYCDNMLCVIQKLIPELGLKHVMPALKFTLQVIITILQVRGTGERNSNLIAFMINVCPQFFLCPIASWRPWHQGRTQKGGAGGCYPPPQCYVCRHNELVVGKIKSRV